MIPSLIHQILKSCGLKQQELADLMGVNLQRVKRLAGGTVQKMTREESEALVRKLNIRADWLLTGKGPMFDGDHAGEDAAPRSPSSEDGEDWKPDFMGRVLEGVVNAYRESGARIGMRDAGKQAMLIYAGIVEALGYSADSKELDAALKVEVHRLRQSLSRPVRRDESKRSA
ncbi:MAG: helix-turn-helix transcriptional regulator [Rhodospirillaceae bacterium]|nr:helix-turn-helix transcriptional regulator [Rhodospirillaceae bacterium]